jgi:hypothetical protein
MPFGGVTSESFGGGRDGGAIMISLFACRSRLLKAATSKECAF